MDDQKDRFGDKIHDLEKAREDQWAREGDRVLLEKLHARQRLALRCPRCETQLVSQVRGKSSVMACPIAVFKLLSGISLVGELPACVHGREYRMGK
jgi:hypothetical protein